MKGIPIVLEVEIQVVSQEEIILKVLNHLQLIRIIIVFTMGMSNIPLIRVKSKQYILEEKSEL